MFKIVVVVLSGTFMLASCTKDYHCQCSYNNQIRLVKDLGRKVKTDATEECNALDTTVTGEKWTCVIY